MKLTSRERVDGTQITIGHRVSYANGKQKISRRYAAEYRDADGKQVCESLGTSNKSQARRLAIEIQQRLDSGLDKPSEATITIDDLAERYFDSVKAKGVAPKTVWKYRADLAKLRQYCDQARITLARRFSADDLYRFRSRLFDKNFAPKTVDGALVLTKQVFKWGWRQSVLRDYRLASATLPKAKARPQPCFTTAEVEALINATTGEERTALALMGYAGLRIGEVEQLRREDLRCVDGKPTMIHVKRGGSNGTTKDKDDRFVPVHPRIAETLGERKASGEILKRIGARGLLKRLKVLCKSCGFDNPQQYKLHSFRHHFASLCANHHVAHRKALAWLGHSSSQMLDLYYHLHDDDSQQAMQALAAGAESMSSRTVTNPPPKGNLRAFDQSTIEKLLQVPEFQEFTNCLARQTERGGFEPPDPCGSAVFKTAALSHSATSPCAGGPRRRGGYYRVNRVLPARARIVASLRYDRGSSFDLGMGRPAGDTVVATSMNRAPSASESGIRRMARTRKPSASAPTVLN